MEALFLATLFAGNLLFLIILGALITDTMFGD